ncbi:TonB-dependent receptor [Nguyenibacter vanlangensis]|uniref:TonB-dependent receptor n=1 Tax=Nguyenibacter vanlangensis TaxID=1216886 RepID=A0A7Y7M6B5_9PROT|nr:TonB-dependent receptor [Nguyenibacter vanlangensis]NVN10749.1 TonB-dependent receptor [Nguyenibacter vanlangensis]
MRLPTTPRRRALISGTVIACAGAWSPAPDGRAATLTTPQAHHAAPPLHPATHPAARPVAAGESISVTGGITTPTGVRNTTPGGGMMPVQTAPKSRSEVTRDFIAKKPANTTVQAMLASMPGVSYARSDPYGQISRGIVVRGLNYTQVGYLVEGIPLTDGVYLSPDAIGGSPDMENVSSVALTQGSPDISSPAYYSVGAEIRTTLRDPARKFGGLLESSYGTWNMKKEFARIDTGEIGHTGIRAFMSYSWSYNRFWQTPGSLTRHHVDAKAIKEWGDGNSAGLTFLWGHYIAGGINANGAATPTKAAFEKLGTSALYYNADYTPGVGSYWQLSRLRNDVLAIVAPVRLNLGSGLKLSVTPYFISWDKWTNYGETISQDHSYYGTRLAGPLSLPDVAANGRQTVEVVDPQHQRTLSLMTDLAWTHGHNTLRAGYWYAYLDMPERANYAATSAQGLPANAWGRYGVTTADGQVMSGWDIVFRQQTNALFLEDAYTALGGRLKMNAGFKAVMIQRWVSNLIPGAATYKNGANYVEPLPQLSASFDITPDDQIYVNGTTSFKAPDRSEAYIDIYDAASPIPIQGHPQNMKSEYAIGEELGYRHNGLVHLSAALFNYNMVNHDVLSTAFVGGSLVTAPIILGGQTIRGAQLEVGLRPWHFFSPYASGSYVHATTDNDFRVGNDLLPTAGKMAVNTPSFTGAIGLAYDDGTYFGNFNLNYIGRRYSTFMNDESMPGYLTSDITLGYRMPTLHVAHTALYRPQIQINLMNIGNNIYYAQAAGLTSNARTMKGLYGTTIAGKSPTYQIGGGFAIAGAVTIGF